MLGRLRADLGVQDGCSLRAELHSMLVYAPGQFFVPHQDSEKADDMVATLVVLLPSTSRGGSLVVEHAGQTTTYRGSQRLLSFVAFYADCRHEVRPVTSGYRVALTYNLLLRGDATAAASTVPPAPSLVGALADCLSEHFVATSSPTTRLVYLLDHAYTARSLGWARLKGSDAARVAALRAAAQRADCVAALALAELHETWSCAESDWDMPYRSRGAGWWDDEPDDEDGSPAPETHELQDLLDWDITLDRWVEDAPGASPEAIVSRVGDDEVCATTPTASLPPTAAEYEGYMGNYGNTMDRWYRRAAVVVWPRRHDFAVRAEARPGWALDALTAQLRAGDVARARELAATLTGFWDDVARAPRPSPGVGEPGEPDTDLFTGALEVAHGLDEPGLAALLLAPFRLELLEPAHALALARLAERYGQNWAEDLLAAWSGPQSPWRYGGDRGRWIGSIGELCAALRDAHSAGTMVARLLLDDAWQWLADAIDTRRLATQPSRREEQLGELAPPIAALLTGAATIGATELRDMAVAFLRDGGDALLPCLVQAQRVTAPLPGAARVETALDMSPLAQHCIQRLEARLQRPPRHQDDWSIDAPAGCECTLCSSLANFLIDRARRELEWPLAEQRRRHVHARIDAHELPVRHQTRRTGRPYTLVLTKTTALFDREAEIRRRDEADLAWLREHSPHTP